MPVEDRDGDGPPECWLCDRPVVVRLQWHHPVPKSKKGRETVPVHAICHKAIHAHFTNAQLRRIGTDREALLDDEALARFVAWVQGKPPEFHAPYRVGKKR